VGVQQLKKRPEGVLDMIKKTKPAMKAKRPPSQYNNTLKL
jgi:hypothetical protein